MHPAVPADELQAVSPDSPTDGFSVRANLEIQFHSGLVIVVGRILILLVNLVLIPTTFILIGFCCAE